MRKRKLFCEINPFCYALSEQKEIIRRYIKDLPKQKTFARKKYNKKLPNVISHHDSGIIKHGKGIDPVLQQNKAINIDLACRSLNGIIIRPGEIFSFWNIIGKTTRKKGYRDGRVIIGDRLIAGIGGGLCNLANTINLLVLHSPMDITEIHFHSDALAPDHDNKRVPFSSGTSVSYNYIDYRFKNNTNQNIQLVMRCKNGRLYGELRSEKPFPWKYEIFEEGHCFRKEHGKYYRVSKIYRNVIEKSTGKIICRELIRDNHSEVMYDYSLIPKDLINKY